MFDNISEFKWYFITFLKYFDIKHVFTIIKNKQANSLVERANQIILNMLVTKDIGNKFFDYIYSCYETLATIAWEIMASYHHNIMATSGQAAFKRNMILNLM